MSNGGVTTTGYAEMLRGVENLPRAVTLALRAVAFRTSRTIYAGAKKLYDQKIHDEPAPAVTFRVDEEEEKQRFLVIAEAAGDKPENLPTWLERGTIHMRARAYMRPPLDAADATYRREMEQASVEAARKALGG